MENEASELKMASLKMILVQCGQLPMFSSLSIVVFPEVVCCQPDLLVGSRSIGNRGSNFKERFMCHSGPGLRYPRS